MFEFIPDAIYGIPLLPLIGLVFGIALAVNEAMRTKFRKTVLKLEANGQTIEFDNKYLVTTLVGVCVVVFTVISVKDSGLLNPVPNNVMGFVVACMCGFTEGWAVIRVLNTRLDVFLKEPNNEAEYALLYIKRAEILGYAVDEESIALCGRLNYAVHLVWEMTWFGFRNEDAEEEEFDS